MPTASKPQIIRDDDGRPAFAVIPWSRYIELLGQENLSDEELFALAREADEEHFPIEVYDRLQAGESPIRVFRQYRRMTQEELAKRVGTNPVYISQIERMTRRGSLGLNKRLADALGVDLDDLISEPSSAD